MVSLTLNLPVIAVNVLVLIPLAKCWLNKLPGSVDLGPNVCTSLMVEQPRGTCQGILARFFGKYFGKYGCVVFTLTLGPPLNLPLGGGGRWLEGEGICGVISRAIGDRDVGDI